MTPAASTQGADDRRPVSSLSYTEASQELEDIVAFFEQRDVDVDQLVTRLERATAIVEELDQRLRRTRAQVESLVPRLEAASDGSSSQAGSSAAEDRSTAAPGEDRSPEVRPAEEYGMHQEASTQDDTPGMAASDPPGLF
jgi:exodeoxyribonuclease VII small subunit